MLSNSAKYAIKAVLFLAVNSNENDKLMVKDIAQHINVPQPYTAKLLQELSRQNIVSSTRGPKGGFYLSNLNKMTPIISIIYAIDGQKRLKSCVLDLEKCNSDKPCPLHDVVHPAKSKFMDYLNENSIGEFADELQGDTNYFPYLKSVLA